MSSFLVIGGTGNQGGATVIALLAASQNVHALVRDPTSDAAKKIKAAGAKLFKGDLSDVNSIIAAAKDTKGVFMNVTPLNGLPLEKEHATNIIAATKAAGVEQIVYPTVINTGKHATFDFDPNSWYMQYFLSKHANEEAVRNGGFKYWTILRPGAFMTNLLQPDSSFIYPELQSEGLIATACQPETPFSLIDPKDIGKFAAAAFLDPERFHGKEIELGEAPYTHQEMADEVSAVTGRKVRTQFFSREEAVELIKTTRPLLESQLYSGQIGQKMDYEKVHEWGIPLTSLRSFLESNKEAVTQNIGEAKP